MDATVLKKEIVRISHLFYQRGWSMATSSNYSARLDSSTILITASGKDKGRLQEEDILRLPLDGEIEMDTDLQPSAEAHLHRELYRSNGNTGGILHTHSVFSTVLSSLPNLKAPISLGGYEMLKALRGVSTHLHTENVPVFANSQDMKVLSDQILSYLRQDPAIHGFLVVAHGLYTWGHTLEEAFRHAEAFEFLIECEYRKRMMENRGR